MPLDANLTFQKALYVLDSGRPQDGEALLREAIDKARIETNNYTLAQSLCCLAEFLMERNRSDDAREVLRQFAGARIDRFVKDVECRRVEEMIERLAM